MNKNRSKGHNFERLIVNEFKNAGYPFCKTTRSASKILDDCGIDIIGTPYLIQCKAGYDKKNFKYEDEKNYTKEKLIKLVGEKEAIKLLNKHPYVFIRKYDTGRGNKKSKDKTIVMLSFEDFIQLIKKTKVEEDEVINIIS